MKNDLVRGLKNVTFEKDKPCSTCQAGKQVGNAHLAKSMMSTTKAFKFLHIDLFGPTTYISMGRNKYDFVIMDDYTTYTWVFFLYDKSEVFDLFKSFIKRVENKFETKIKKVKSDNESEFKNIRVEELCDELGIGHQFSPKYTPQYNGIVERKNRTLIYMARSILYEYNMSQNFWA